MNDRIKFAALYSEHYNMGDIRISSGKYYYCQDSGVSCCDCTVGVKCNKIYGDSEDANLTETELKIFKESYPELLI